jgi:hypothetical protein
MDNKYDYNSLISICNKMKSGYDTIDAEEMHLSSDEKMQITDWAVDSVKEKMFTFVTNEQRFSFIKSIFEKLFNPNNLLFFVAVAGFDWTDKVLIEHEAEIILEERIDKRSYLSPDEGPEYYVQPSDKYFLDEKSRYFIVDCYFMAYRFTWMVSEIAFDYNMKGFEDIMTLLETDFTQAPFDLRPHFTYLMSNGEWKDKGVVTPEISELIKEVNELYVVDKSIASESGINYTANQIQEETGVLMIDDFYTIFKPQYRPHTELFISILRDLNLINSRNEWQGDKTACRIFFDCLKSYSIIIPNIGPTPGSRIFETKFPGTKNMFVKTPTDAAKYKVKTAIDERIEQLLTDIPLLKN